MSNEHQTLVDTLAEVRQTALTQGLDPTQLLHEAGYDLSDTGNGVPNRYVQGADEYTLSDVEFDSRLVDVTFASELWPARSQVEHIVQYGLTDLRLPSSDLYFAVMKRLATHCETGEEKKILGLVRNDLREGYVMTGSRVMYSGKKRKDTLVHDWGVDSHQSPQGSDVCERVVTGLTLIGPQARLEDLDNRETIAEAYFGSTFDEVCDVVNELVEAPVRFWRLNEQPHEVQMRPVTLDYIIVGFRVTGHRDGGLARGVFVRNKR